jgi:hypothetical protein
LKKNPLRDLHRVGEHPERISKRLVEKTKSQEAVTFSSLTGEGWKDEIP